MSVAALLQCALLGRRFGWRTVAGARLLDPKRLEEVGRRTAEPRVLEAALEGAPCAAAGESASGPATAALVTADVEPARSNGAVAQRTLRAVEAELTRCKGEGERLATEARGDPMVREAKEYMERLGVSIERMKEHVKHLDEQKKKLEKNKEQIANVLAAEHAGLTAANQELSALAFVW